MTFFNSAQLKKKLFKSEKGFTLVELLVALSILTLIIFAFTPLLVTSIERIHYAGDKSEALYEGQSEVEVNIAERKTTEGSDLVFTFIDPDNSVTVIEIPGGLVDVEKSRKDAIAWLSGFVPYIPTIDLYLSPLPLVEGYNDIDIIIMGKDTVDDTAITEENIVTVYDVNGFKVEECKLTIIEYFKDLPEGYDQYAKFTLSEGLTNSRSPYMPSLKWELDGGIEVYVETRLQIVLPYAVAVGKDKTITISPDYETTWKNRSHSATGSVEFTDIIWTGFEYAAVSKSSNNIIIWKDRQEPLAVHQASAPLNSITYGAGLLVAVGNSGHVVTSPDRNFWTVYSTGSSHLEAVSYDNSKFVAVGANGTIMSSVDGETWEPETVNWAEEDGDGSAVTFKGIAHGGGKWLAVGKNGSNEGVIYASAVGGWEKVNYGEETGDEDVVNGDEDIVNGDEDIVNGDEDIFNHGLNDIIYDGSRFIVVGESGTVISSKSGNEWDIIFDGSKNLNAISFARFTGDIINYVIAGNNGTIITGTGTKSSTNDSYLYDFAVVQSSGTTSDLNGVALRWTP